MVAGNRTKTVVTLAAVVMAGRVLHAAPFCVAMTVEGPPRPRRDNEGKRQ